MKAKKLSLAKRFEDIPNVGPRIADDFRLLGLRTPGDLKGHDPYDLYRRLNKKAGQRQDPCVLDTFMSVIDFANGAPAKPWWKYTAKRKKNFPDL